MGLCHFLESLHQLGQQLDGEVPAKGIERKSQLFVASIRSESLISGPGALLSLFTHRMFCNFAAASIGKLQIPSKRGSNVVAVTPAGAGPLLGVTHGVRPHFGVSCEESPRSSLGAGAAPVGWRLNQLSRSQGHSEGRWRSFSQSWVQPGCPARLRPVSTDLGCPALPAAPQSQCHTGGWRGGRF